MEEKPLENGLKRNEKGQFVLGNTGGPGRKGGQSMKEYVRDFLAAMTPEEKKEWLKGVSPELAWRMGEGNPHQTSEHSGEVKTILSLLDGTAISADNRHAEGSEVEEED